MIIGKSRTNQPVEGDNDALALSLTGKDIAPKDVNATGKVTGGEIIENMSGYSAEYISIPNLTMENVYVGAVKNGNKLTIVCATNFTKLADLVGSQSYLIISIPSEVLSKLYPTTIGIYDCLAFTQVKAVASSGQMKDINILIEKQTNNILIDLQGDTINELPANVKTYVRVEATFLLSDNLVPEPEEPKQEGE